MSYQIKKYGLLLGDEIIVPKSGFNIVQHHALYIGNDAYGSHWIVENNYQAGVRKVEASRFFQENPIINKVNRFFGTDQSRDCVVKDALSKIGTQYNLFKYNCEHFTNHVRNGHPTSKQVQFIKLFLAAIAVSVVAFALYLLLNPKKRRYA